MKKLRITLVVILSIIFLFELTLVEYVPAKAAINNTSTYVALGDSITTGYGLVNFNKNDIKNKSSVDNFVNKLSKRLGQKAINLGIEGLDSTRLLEVLISPTTSEQKAVVAQIKTARLITISIGGNNVLQPLLTILNEKLGAGKSIYTASTQEIQTAAAGLLFDKLAMDNLQNAITEGTLTFNGDSKQKKSGDFASIISVLKKLNPKAQIIVQTIYNPYNSVLTSIFDSAIMSMNAKIIKDSANGKNYKVADVYMAFSKALPGTKLVNADLVTSVDPHPTAKGHEVIYTVVSYIAQNNTLPYNVKATITKGKLITTVSEGELILSVTPIKGYKAPKSISYSIGKGAKKTLTLSNGKASIPVADVNAEIVVTGICSK